MSFHVGQKVICINNAPKPDRDGEMQAWRLDTPRRLKRGAIYTIRGIAPDGDGYLGVYLFEVRDAAPALYDGRERPFDPARFRPIVSRSTETGVAILRQILADHKTPVKEKALSSFRVTGT